MSSSGKVSRECLEGGNKVHAFGHAPLGQLRHLKGVLEHDECAIKQLVVG
jgi:hypothetical protein